MKLNLIKIFFSFFCLLFLNELLSQTVLIKDKIPNDFSVLDEGIGPNRKRYSYSYLGIGKILPASFTDSVLSVKWNALKVSSGYTGKYQATNLIGLLFDFEFSFESFALNNLDSSNTIDYNSSINKARYVFYKIGSDVAFQFNFRPKRGNQLGTYLTLGSYLDYNAGRRFVTKAKFENGLEVNQKNTYKKPSFTTPFQYGIVAKFGKHNWDLFAKYRLSNAFNNGLTEIPRLIVGIELLFHEKR